MRSGSADFVAIAAIALGTMGSAVLYNRMAEDSHVERRSIHVEGIRTEIRVNPDAASPKIHISDGIMTIRHVPNVRVRVSSPELDEHRQLLLERRLRFVPHFDRDALPIDEKVEQALRDELNAEADRLRRDAEDKRRRHHKKKRRKHRHDNP